MTKYTQVLKQQIVEYYFQHHQSISKTATHFQVAQRSIRQWIAQYQYSGLDGLAVLDIPRKYRLEDKLKAIEYIQHTELTWAYQTAVLFINGCNGSKNLA
ncbi:helix-turn-helix domain-containing protein [Testudinibacter sp. P80/BLE/0925]|uniref:helix-turn-helix domain-containing protein n=1 Tax=Testudinibacter sp. TW-1 TaxID=3417757 RepID=UPI003D361EA3